MSSHEQISNLIDYTITSNYDQTMKIVKDPENKNEKSNNEKNKCKNNAENKSDNFKNDILFLNKKIRRGKIKIYYKKILENTLQVESENFILHPSKYISDSESGELIKNNSMDLEQKEEDLFLNKLNKKQKKKAGKILSVLLEILNKNNIEVDLNDFGNYNLTYVFENFKKQKDNKIVSIIKEKVTKGFKGSKINISVIPLLQKLFLQDFNAKRILLEKLNFEPNSKLYSIVNQEDIKEKEVFYILFFFIRLRKFEENAKLKTGKLDFSGNYLSGDSLQRLLYPLIYVNNVRHLDFSGNKLGNLGMLYLGNVMRYNTNIIELDISYNYINDNALFFFLLEIGYYKFDKIENSQSNKNFVTESKGFVSKYNEVMSEADFEELERIPDDIINDYRENPSKFLQKNKDKNLLKIFKLSIKKNYNIESKEYDTENKQATKLLKFNLSNNLEIRDGELVIDILKCCPLLKSLNLSRTGLIKNNLDDVMKYLLNTMQQDSEKSFSDKSTLENSNIIFEEEISINNFEYVSNLEILSMSNMQFTQKSLDLLGDFIASESSKLKLLSLSEVKFSDFRIIEFFNNLKKSKCLEEIYLKECDLPLPNDEEARNAFLDFVRECPNLKNLCVYCNKLKDEKFFYDVLGAIQERTSSLKVLDYSNNQVPFSTKFSDKNDNELISIFGKMRNKPDKIEFIDLSQNFNFQENAPDEKFIEKIAEIQKDFKIIY